MFCIHRSCELRFLIQSHVNNWQLTLIFHVSFDPLAPETQHRAVDCVFPLLLCSWLNCFADILQAACDRGHHPLQLFPSISFHFLAGLTCLMPVSLTPSTALTDILMHLAALGFSSDNPVRHALGHFPLVSCPM